MTEDIMERAKRLREALFEAAVTIDSLIALCGSQEASVGTVERGGVVAATEEIAVHVIEAVGRPLTTRALLPLVEAEIPVGGKSPLSTLSARLSSAKRLVRVPEGWQVRR